jgi:hypothetical protein
LGFPSSESGGTLALQTSEPPIELPVMTCVAGRPSGRAPGLTVLLMVSSDPAMALCDTRKPPRLLYRTSELRKLLGTQTPTPRQHEAAEGGV